MWTTVTEWTRSVADDGESWRRGGECGSSFVTLIFVHRQTDREERHRGGCAVQSRIVAGEELQKAAAMSTASWRPLSLLLLLLFLALSTSCDGLYEDQVGVWDWYIVFLLFGTLLLVSSLEDSESCLNSPY